MCSPVPNLFVCWFFSFFLFFFLFARLSTFLGKGLCVCVLPGSVVSHAGLNSFYLMFVFFSFLNKLDLFISLTFVQFAVHLTRHLVGAYDDLVINCIIFILLLLRVVDRILDYCPVPLLFSFAMCVCVSCCLASIHPSGGRGWMDERKREQEGI